jgi:hypothetical protein
MAKLAALDCNSFGISDILGVDESFVALLLDDPTFNELIAQYRRYFASPEGLDEKVDWSALLQQIAEGMRETPVAAAELPRKR